MVFISEIFSYLVYENNGRGTLKIRSFILF
jgi:hypothetical protein